MAWGHSVARSGLRVHWGSRGFTWARVKGRCDHSGSVGSFGFAWVNFGAPRGRRDHASSRGLNRARQGVVSRGRPVHSGLREFSLVGIGFIRIRVSSLGCDLGSSRSFWCAWVHSDVIRGRRVNSGSRGYTLARQVVVGFIWVRVSSLWRAFGSSDLFESSWVRA